MMEELPQSLPCSKRQLPTLWRLGCAVAIGLLLLVLACGMPLLPVMWQTWKLNQQRDSLIRRSDHQAILAACRKLMATCPRELPQGGDYCPHTLIQGDDNRLPKALQDLHPFYAAVSRESIIVELHGGFYHCGVIAFAAGVEERGGTQKLIDGLWWYTEE